MKWPSPECFLQTSSHCLRPQRINVGPFLLQFFPKLPYHVQILDQRACVYTHVCLIFLSQERTNQQYLWSNWYAVFLQLFSNTDLPTLESSRKKKIKEETMISNSGEYNWLHKQFRLFCSLWFLQAYFYLCFIAKAFPITRLFVKLRFNIWNL